MLSRFAVPLLLLLVATSCGIKKKPLTDWDRICDVMKLSHAEDAESSHRMLVAMKWLAENLTDPEAMKFLAEAVQVAPAEGRAMLIAEAKKHGIDKCAWANDW